MLGYLPWSFISNLNVNTYLFITHTFFTVTRSHLNYKTFTKKKKILQKRDHKIIIKFINKLCILIYLFDKL